MALIFGKHTKEDAKALMSINPIVNEVGTGPIGKTCKGCQHWRSAGYGWCAANSKKVKRDWPACRLYEESK